MRSATLLLLILVGQSPALGAGPESAPTKGVGQKAYFVVNIRGTIGSGFTAAEMEAVISEAKRKGIGAIVLVVDTPGGMISEAEAIVDLIMENEDLRFVAFVKKALSAGAVITLACKEIYITETATFGAAVSFFSDKRGLPLTLPRDVAEKFQSAWRAVCRKAADHGGHPSILAEGMADPDFAITKRTVGGKTIFERSGPGEVVKAQGRILTLTAKEAVKHGLATMANASAANIGDEVGLSTWRQVDTAEVAQLKATVYGPTLTLGTLNGVLYRYAKLPLNATAAAKRAKLDEITKEIQGRHVRLRGRLVNVVDYGDNFIIYVNYTLRRTIYTPAARYSKPSPVVWPVEIIDMYMLSSDKQWIAAKIGSLVTLEGRIVNMAGSIYNRQVRWSDYKGSHTRRPVTNVDIDLILLESEAEPTEQSPSPTHAPVEAETKAKSKLNLAENYISSSMSIKAMAILRSIIREYPDTAAAKRAAKLIKTLEAEIKKTK